MKKIRLKRRDNLTDSHTPSTIYRYHSPNIDRLISMIKTDNFTIRLAHPSEFNDINDTVIPINVDPHQKMVRYYTRLLESAYCYMYIAQDEAKRDGVEIDSQNLLVNAVQEAYFGKPIRFERCRIKKDTANVIRMELKSHVSKYFKDQHTKFSRALSANLGICCFTTDIQSPAMWGLYAIKNTGYAFEYDMADIIEIGKTGYGIHPVVYQPDTTDETTEILKISVSCLTSYMGYFEEFEDIVENIVVSEDGNITWDVLNDSAKILGNATNDFSKEMLEDKRTLTLAIKHSLCKTKEWENEKEWRLLMQLKSDAKEDERYIPISPRAIYLGANMPENEVLMIKHALHEMKSTIKLYQIQQNIMTQKLDVQELRYV